MNLELQRRYRRLFRFYDWVVNEQKFVDSHEEVVSALARLPVQARIFIAKAAVGFLDCLNLNWDGVLELAMAGARALSPQRSSAPQGWTWRGLTIYTSPLYQQAF